MKNENNNQGNMKIKNMDFLMKDLKREMELMKDKKIVNNRKWLKLCRRNNSNMKEKKNNDNSIIKEDKCNSKNNNTKKKEKKKKAEIKAWLTNRCAASH